MNYNTNIANNQQLQKGILIFPSSLSKFVNTTTKLKKYNNNKSLFNTSKNKKMETINRIRISIYAIC